ncbi:Uu.00g035960.m01.CDS01 [Anthostomella pinea]|uniref:Uu.00g035960.m01.CDS01 n=1 Tax=Anthostomella pinea TaxID=933095 RepID=A0AAI8V9F7_9PEZI|nr:Uu.00g035960.m01.CDS01 [Anthostomella pinea]
MSAFGGKRKARKITVQDDEDESPPVASLNPPAEPQEPALQASFKTSRKPFKQSSLRKSINVSDEAPAAEDPSTATHPKDEPEDTEDGGAPLRIRPSIGRTVSTKSKKRQSASRLSFGPSETTGDDDAMVLGEEVFTPKKATLGASATENSAYKKGISKNLPLNRLPMRSIDSDDNRPRYSKEYLSELQSSTPNTPQNISRLQPASDDEMSLDPSELEGAMVVDTMTAAPSNTAVLTEAQVREKKERRARLAKHGGRDTDDFISLSDDERDAGDSYLSVLSRKTHHTAVISNGSKPKKSSDTRLIAEDEDLGEGYDDFVEDGGLSLGKKAEREARRRQRAEMASLITTAEGGASDHESDDSEAERLAAYEAAQTRAGMDGLAEEREQQRRRLGGGAEGVVQVPPRITSLPDLSVLVQEFKAQMRRKEEELGRMRARIEELRVEREGVLQREPEVQRLLNEAGERYKALMMPGTSTPGVPGDGDVGGGNAEDNVASAKSLLDQVRGSGGDTPRGERGLESLGTTPVRPPQMEV